jgi:hypothetical protein
MARHSAHALAREDEHSAVRWHGQQRPTGDYPTSLTLPDGSAKDGAPTGQRGSVGSTTWCAGSMEGTTDRHSHGGMAMVTGGKGLGVDL